MRTRLVIGLVVVVSLVAGPALAKKKKDGAQDVSAPAAPEVDPTDPAGLVAAAAAALGGAEGGHAALSGLAGYKVTYRMEANDTMAGKSYVADHVFERGTDGALKLEVDLVKGSGEDSVAYAGAEEAWVEADGERTEFQPDEVRRRIDDFAPESLFQVPLDLANRGLESFPEEIRERLVVESTEEEIAAGKLVVRGIDTGGVEQIRLTLDRASGRPVGATFASVAGRIEYRFDDYREVAPGLILPFRRTFLRNGVLLSDLTVTAFEVLESPEEAETEGAEGASEGGAEGG